MRYQGALWILFGNEILDPVGLESGVEYHITCFLLPAGISHPRYSLSEVCSSWLLGNVHGEPCSPLNSYDVLSLRPVNVCEPNGLYAETERVLYVHPNSPPRFNRPLHCSVSM